MSVEENKEVVKQFIDSSHINDSESIDKLAADSFLFHPLASSAVLNKETYKQMLTYGLPAYKDLSIDYNNIIAEDEMVMMRITVQGTHVGQMGNIAPTGNTVSFAEFFVFRIDNGEIAEMWGLRDNLSVYQQLGALPPTEEIGK